jgi:hypothetical protein
MVSKSKPKEVLLTPEEMAVRSKQQNTATRLHASMNKWGTRPPTFAERTRFDRTIALRTS